MFVDVYKNTAEYTTQGSLLYIQLKFDEEHMDTCLSGTHFCELKFK